MTADAGTAVVRDNHCEQLREPGGEGCEGRVNCDPGDPGEEREPGEGRVDCDPEGCAPGEGVRAVPVVLSSV